MGRFSTSVVKTARARRHVDGLDRDPSKWPVAPGVRIYMVDCEFCPSRMPLWAMPFHVRRHQRIDAATSNSSE